MLITTYKEANQLQSSCISLPTATVPAVTLEDGSHAAHKI